MWSGNDRDDFICTKESLNDYPMRYEYCDGVAEAISGGSSPISQGNIKFDWQSMRSQKNKQSRAIENYLEIRALRDFLDLQKYRYVFLNYLDTRLPSRTSDFSIDRYLPKEVRQEYLDMFLKAETIYQWALKKNMLLDDDLHPTPDAHLSWTREILIPALSKLNITESLA
jgi:hypothetical protein